MTCSEAGHKGAVTRHREQRRPVTSEAQVNVAALLASVRYDPATNKIFWRKREPWTFDREIPPGAVTAWNSHFAGKEAFAVKGPAGRIVGSFNSRKILKHRVVWLLVHGEWPRGHIDHINGDPADNRIENLRVTDHSGNMRNRKLSKNNKSGHHGVCKERNSWRAYITHGGKQRLLGFFRSKEEAVRVRKEAERLHGYHENHGRAGRDDQAERLLALRGRG